MSFFRSGISDQIFTNGVNLTMDVQRRNRLNVESVKGTDMQMGISLHFRRSEEENESSV